MNGKLLETATVVMLIAAPHAATGQANYPAQPVHVIVPVAPGGGLDTFSRTLTREFSARTRQQFIADNRPGAGTTIGTAVVARARPDGYTLLSTTASFAISPAIYRSIPYEPVRDFAPVVLAVATPNLVAVHPTVPARSLRELIALARSEAAKGDPMFYASGGSGTNGHMAGALFGSVARIRMTHVPYKSGSLGVIDLIAGQVPLMIDSMSSLLPHARAGRLRALAVTGAQRAAAAAELPTIAEAGLPGAESGQWYGLLAPAGTPPEIIARLNRETIAILQLAGVRARLAADGIEVVGSTPDEFAARIRADIAKWSGVVKSVGIPRL